MPALVQLKQAAQITNLCNRQGCVASTREWLTKGRDVTEAVQLASTLFWVQG